VTSQQFVISVLWDSAVYCVKLSEDLSHYSNKIESVFKRKCSYYHDLTVLLRKWCHNNKRFAERAPHHGGKTAGIDTV